MDKWFNVGKIVNTQGIKGEVKVLSQTDFKEERYQPGNELYIFKNDQESTIKVTIKHHRVHKNFDILAFEEFSDINEVEPLKGSIIKVNENQLSELADGEYYFYEIIGCDVYTMDGEKLGKVSEILTPGANDVWVVKREKGKDILIPYIPDIVKEIDANQKIVRIQPMEGLYDAD